MLAGTQNRSLARLLCLVGLAVTGAMICLGAVWPSYFTILAIPVLPAPFLFVAAVARPRLLTQSSRLRIYLRASVILSLLCIAEEWIWLHLRS